MRYGWLAIVAAGAIVYANSLDNSFHYDDEHSIQHNIHLRSLANVPRFFIDPAMFSVDADKAMYRPLLLVTYALNFAAGSYEVAGFRAVNILLHVLCALTVGALARRLSDCPHTGLLAGLLFAVHPLGTEPVNYISSRSESLAALFFLLGVWLYVRASQEGNADGRGLTLLAMALGLLSKATPITMPAVLLAYDLVHGTASPWRTRVQSLVRRHWPFWGLTLFHVGVIWFNGFLSDSVRNPVRSMSTQWLTQLKAITFYVHRLALPVNLNVEPQFTAATRNGTVVLTSLAFALTLLFLALHSYRRGRRRILFLAVLGAAPMLPVMIMPLNILVNERRLYLPAAAVCMALALVLGGGRRGRDLFSARLHRGAVVALVWLLTFAGMTMQRNRDWRDEHSLWHAALRTAPLMPRVHLYLGNAHKNAAMSAPCVEQANAYWQQALASYRRTIELDPMGELGLRGLNNVGAVHFMLDDIDAAESAYQRAVGLDPHYADARVNLGSVLHERARRRTVRDAVQRELLLESVRAYERALRLSPNHPLAYANLGLAYFDLGEFERAGQAYERAYHINPADFRLLNNMGNLHVSLSMVHTGERSRAHLLQARHHYTRALQLNPAFNPPRAGLQEVQARLDRTP